jgi:hypothetical protein
MRHRFIASIIMLMALALSTGCSFKQEADAKFGDQGFKTVISLIELHKTRFGHYPETLSELKYTGDWDPIAINSVQYRRLDNGYELNIVRGWVGRPTLSYPADFWHGLGLVSSNVGGAPHASQAPASGQLSPTP